MYTTINHIDYKVGIHDYVFMLIGGNWIKSTLTKLELYAREKEAKAEDKRVREKARKDNAVQAIRNEIPEHLRGFIFYRSKTKTYSVHITKNRKKPKVGETKTLIKAIRMQYSEERKYKKAVIARTKAENLTASQKAIMAGFDTLMQVASLTGMTTRNLNYINRNKPKVFETLLLSLNEEKV